MAAMWMRVGVVEEVAASAAGPSKALAAARLLAGVAGRRGGGRGAGSSQQEVAAGSVAANGDACATLVTASRGLAELEGMAVRAARNGKHLWRHSMRHHVRRRRAAVQTQRGGGRASDRAVAVAAVPLPLGGGTGALGGRCRWQPQFAGGRW